MKTHNHKKPKRSIYYKSMPGASNVEGNIATGYLAAFGNKDSDKDILIKGCCAKSIRERGPESSTPRKIAFLHTHRMDLPLGRFTKLEELDAGLYYEAELDNIPFVRDTVKPQMESKTLNNHSIGHNYVWDQTEYVEDQDAFICKEIDLYEGSILVLGSNENTPFTGFKSFLETTDQLGELALKANKLLKKVPDYKKEMELRSILQKYQSLLDYAAEEITAMKKQPKRMDYKFLIENFKL